MQEVTVPRVAVVVLCKVVLERFETTNIIQCIACWAHALKWVECGRSLMNSGNPNQNYQKASSKYHANYVQMVQDLLYFSYDHQKIGSQNLSKFYSNLIDIVALILRINNLKRR